MEHIHANFHRHHMHNKEIKGGGWQPSDGSLPFMRTIHYKKSFTLIHKRNVVQRHSATTRGCTTLFRAWLVSMSLFVCLLNEEE